jgi:hypothetical protein
MTRIWCSYYQSVADQHIVAFRASILGGTAGRHGWMLRSVGSAGSQLASRMVSEISLSMGWRLLYLMDGRGAASWVCGMVRLPGNRDTATSYRRVPGRRRSRGQDLRQNSE